ncbi:reverse transcriptase domain-containing protein [Tanacetum coccineum]
MKMFRPKEVKMKSFPLERLNMVTSSGDSSTTSFCRISWGLSRLHEGTNIYSWPSTTCQNGLKQKRSPPPKPGRCFVANFLKSLFARIRCPRSYHKWSAKPIFAMTSFEQRNRGDEPDHFPLWSDKLDDALWAFRTAYKTPIECTPYKLVYRKACHLPIELEHKACWALKRANFDLGLPRDLRKVQLNELNELRDHAIELFDL